MIHFLVPAATSFSIDEYVTREPWAAPEHFRVMHYEDLSAHAPFQRGTYVLAGLDQLERESQRTVVDLYAQLSAASDVRVLNHPVKTLKRYDLLNTLHGLGRSGFRVVRGGGDLQSLRYPVYLRQERFHGGNISPLLHTPREVERALGRAVVSGFPWTDILVVEFCPTANAEGVYRKYAAFRLGKRILARSCYVGRQWMLKFEESDFTDAIVREEQEYVRSNPHVDQLAEIFEIAACEYGQLDYSMKDGRVQAWEINLNPTIGRMPGPSGGWGPREHWPIRDATRELFFDRFREAWAEVDTLSGDSAPIEVRATRPIQVAPPAPTSRGRGTAAIVALLRPLKWLLVPLATPFLRWLPVVMRWRHRSRG